MWVWHHLVDKLQHLSYNYNVHLHEVFTTMLFLKNLYSNVETNLI